MDSEFCNECTTGSNRTSNSPSRDQRHRVCFVVHIILPFFLDADEATYDPRRLAIEDVPASPFAGPPTAPAPMPAKPFSS